MRSHTIEQERTVRDLRPSRNRWPSVGALVDRLDAVFERRVVSRPAAIVLVDGESLDDAGLRAHLEPLLAKFKIPNHVWFLDEPLPQNANGKFVKRTLQEQLLSSD